MERRYQAPSRIVNGASTTLFQWQQAQVKQQSVISAMLVKVWLYGKHDPHSTGWKTCNVDAALLVNSGRSSFRCVLSDAAGSFISSKVDLLQEL